MVQCERRKNTKQYQGHAAAQKSAAWPAERHNTSGAYPAGAPAFLRLCIYVFCAAPLKLRHSRRDRRTAAAPGGCRGRITSVRAAYCTARKKTPPAARGRKILCVKSRCAMRLCFGVAAVFCPHGVGRPEPRPWSIRRIFRCRPLRHIAENGLSPILVTLRGGGQAHGEAALPAPLLQKGPALHSCMEYQTSRCCKAGAPRLSAFSSALPESGRSTGR